MEAEGKMLQACILGQEQINLEACHGTKYLGAKAQCPRDQENTNPAMSENKTWTTCTSERGRAESSKTYLEH